MAFFFLHVSATCEGSNVGTTKKSTCAYSSQDAMHAGVMAWRGSGCAPPTLIIAISLFIPCIMNIPTISDLENSPEKPAAQEVHIAQITRAHLPSLKKLPLSLTPGCYCTAFNYLLPFHHHPTFQ